MKLNRHVLGHSIWAELNELNDGLDVGIYGGCSTHVGAVTLAEADGTYRTIERDHHKDSFISKRWAVELAKLLHVPVCVRCGIHYDNATKDQLTVITASCDEMLQTLMLILKQERKNL